MIHDYLPDVSFKIYNSNNFFRSKLYILGYAINFSVDDPNGSK